jgi:prepilin-type N-terminal cleavage/methylation domain-containing protein
LRKRCAQARVAVDSGLGKGMVAPAGSGSAGFTLVELVIATLISSLVMGIVAVALGFSLRIWERQQRQNPSDMPAVVELLKWQLATFEPQPVRVDQESMPIFKGDAHSLTFATTHSVKAISRGAPVLVRYLFVPSDKALYYIEIPFDPYHPEPIEQFLKLTPGKDTKRRGFFSTAVSNLSFSFAAQDGSEGFEEKWEEGSGVPEMVVVKWSPDGQSRFTAAVVPNSLFPKPVQDAGVEGSAFKRKK